MKTWSLIIILLQVDYIEDDGWDFCSALWQLNLQGNQVLLHLGLFVLVPIGIITTVVLHSFVLVLHHLASLQLEIVERNILRRLPSLTHLDLRCVSGRIIIKNKLLGVKILDDLCSTVIIIENIIGCQNC